MSINLEVFYMSQASTPRKQNDPEFELSIWQSERSVVLPTTRPLATGANSKSSIAHVTPSRSPFLPRLVNPMLIRVRTAAGTQTNYVHRIQGTL